MFQEEEPVKFERRCAWDADFSLIQCCTTCGFETSNSRFAEIFREVPPCNNYDHKTLQGENSFACFDRHGPAFCGRFLTKSDVWGRGQWSCEGEHAQLAFRVCRKTCGYCKKDIQKTAGGELYVPTNCGRHVDESMKDIDFDYEK